MLESRVTYAIKIHPFHVYWIIDQLHAVRIHLFYPFPLFFTLTNNLTPTFTRISTSIDGHIDGKIFVPPWTTNIVRDVNLQSLSTWNSSFCASLEDKLWHDLTKNPVASQHSFQTEWIEIYKINDSKNPINYEKTSKEGVHYKLELIERFEQIKCINWTKEKWEK